MTFLASIALSWLGIGGAVLAAVLASALILYARLPASWLVTVWLACGAWLYTGLVYQDGVAHERAAVEVAVNAERTRQAAVRAKVLDNAAEREIAANAENDALQDKVAAYEAELSRAPAPPAPPAGSALACPDPFKLGPADASRLRQFQ